MARVFQRRKVAPKVKDGAVQKKNRHQPTAGIGYVIDRESPAKGFRHVLTKSDVHRFTGIIPGWADLSLGLESIVLTRSSADHDGVYHFYAREKTGSIHVPAWEGELWTVFTLDYFAEHQAILTLLEVACGPDDDGVECRFTLGQARAYLLLHIFLHELGHHVDRIASKQQNASRRGEPFAERYANELAVVIWPDYLRVFGDPRR